MGAHRALKGRDADGKWRTAHKRAYTSALCNLLAAVVVDQLAIVAPSVADLGDFTLPGDLAPFAVMEHLPAAVVASRWMDLDSESLKKRRLALEDKEARRSEALERAAVGGPLVQQVIAEGPLPPGPPPAASPGNRAGLGSRSLEGSLPGASWAARAVEDEECTEEDVFGFSALGFDSSVL